MRKSVKALLIAAGVLVAIPVLALGTTSVVNAVATSAEASSITSYGQRVPVDGKEMNVVVRGSGETTIVLLPGLGTAAPALDFEPLIQQLSTEYTVVAVEPFGTGLSDQSDMPRTGDNIAREVHEALQYLGVDRYVLMGHSIAGIYALPFSAAYGDELIAFVGIDSSVPDQPGAGEAIPTDLIVTLDKLGITRLLGQGADDAYAGLPYDERVKKQMRLLSTKNTAAPTMIDEMATAPANFAAVSGTSFPSELPVLLFVLSSDPDSDDWVALHERQAESADIGQVVLMDGDHYLHHTQSREIVEDTAAFLQALPAR